MPRRSTKLDSAALDRAAGVIRCLGHPLRLRLLDALESGEASVTELQARTGASQAMVSQQLATLRGHGVVTARRDGPFVRYSVVDPHVHRILACIRSCTPAVFP
jgi:DNA-binding transcriptional ArsR family regulator